MVHEGDHTEFRAKLNAYSAGVLDDVEWLVVRTHLAECELCRAELGRPELWNRAAPQRISPTPQRVNRRPGWPVVIGAAAVAALIAFGVGYALGVTA
ncbi:hypothetical protein ABT337_28705 [Saccharopolyspora hirsuta]|uniref:Zf-HC2 domain-containing protein n=1 Tax=Saccharopolyspora hirsuta TaxID=1837 RepID=A0A5M7C2A4_SACHI|nr:hypothetical protein [Saccharopolyspora hirsuta]KAA5832585.1 hypothetical protein F1721_16410 [Saccharopolyspora hirsuta]